MTKATKDGTALAHDVSQGKIECQISITQTGATEPTVTPGEAWYVSAPLTLDNPDSDYQTWSCTLAHNLARS